MNEQTNLIPTWRERAILALASLPGAEACVAEVCDRVKEHSKLFDFPLPDGFAEEVRRACMSCPLIEQVMPGSCDVLLIRR